MPTLPDEVVQAAIARAKREVLEDIAAGHVPGTVTRFSQLHDYVDANEYGGLTEGPFYDEARLDDPAIDSGVVDHSATNKVQDAVDAWLKAGRPPERRVLPRRTDGAISAWNLAHFVP